MRLSLLIMRNKHYCRLIEWELVGKRSVGKVRLIFGARQTGKTMLLGRLLQSSTSVTFNLLDSALRRRFEKEPAAFRREVLALPAAIRGVAVDEIQKVPALLEEVQYVYDKHPERFDFYLTGSSARKLRRHSANLLPGRSHLYHLYPVTRHEERDYSSRLYELPHESGEFPEQDLERRLLFGSLPGVRAEEPETAAATLEAYVENYLEEEIRREGAVRELGPFMHFIRLSALESGRQINVARLSQESGVPASTVRNYYQLLVDTFTGYWLSPFARPGRKRLLTTPRFYFFDIGVRNAAAGLPFLSGLSPDAGGALLEQWVGLELIHRAGYFGRTHGVSFWRTTTGAEVDFIWQSPDEDVPIEVKWTDCPRPADARHVERFLDLYAGRARRGYVVCRVERAQQLSERVMAIPWREL